MTSVQFAVFQPQTLADMRKGTGITSLVYLRWPHIYMADIACEICGPSLLLQVHSLTALQLGPRSRGFFWKSFKLRLPL